MVIPRGESPVETEMVTDTMTETEKAYILGKGYVCTKKARGNGRESYTWQVTHSPVIEILEKIRPYLRIKTRQADLLIQ
jgi:hypothetical protein